jgi:hypothetical protein
LWNGWYKVGSQMGRWYSIYCRHDSIQYRVGRMVY